MRDEGTNGTGERKNRGAHGTAGDAQGPSKQKNDVINLTKGRSPFRDKSAGAKGTNVDSLIERAISARHSEKHTAALDLFTAAAALRPGQLALQLEIAETLCDLNRLDEAAERCKRVLAEAPQNTKACMVLGFVARKGRDHEAACVHFAAAVASKPKSIPCQFELAQTLRKLGRVEESEARCRQILAQDPGHARAALLLGTLALQRGDVETAIEQFDAVTARAPGSIDQQIKIVRSLREAGRLTEAETRCRRILDRDPHHPRAAVELGAILRHRQDLAAALLQMESAAEKNPTDVQTQLQLGQVLLALRRHDEAKAKFLIALELGQDKIAAHQGLAKAARAVSDWPQSLHHLEAVAGLTPLDTSVLLDIATVQFEMLLFDDAEATLQRAENHAEGGSSERYLARKFEYFCVTTQWERAAQCLAQWPTHRDVPRVAVADVVRFYAERGHWHDVIDFFRERVIEQGWSGAIQGSEVLLDTLAGAIRHTGRYDEALQLLDRWPDDDSAAAAHNLRDQIAEEVSLLRAIGLLEHDAESQGKPITNPLRAERHALLAGMLARNMSAASKAANTIFYCADAKYLLGATVSLFSLLRHNLAQLKDCTFVVYCSPELLEFASTVFGEIGVFFGTEIEVRSSAALIAEDMAFRTKWGAFTPGRGLSVAAYYRIFAAVQLLEQKGKGRALYIDADTCVGPGMDALLHFDLAGMPIAARREDPLGPAIMRATARLGIEKGEYFNSGVLLFDLANRELEAALRLSIDTALHRQHLLIMVDQCALNIGFNKLSTGLPAEFNYFIRDDNEVVFPEQIPVITHFTAHPKPWDPSYQTRHCMHWFQEFAALGGALEPDRLKRLLAYSFPQGHGAWQGANIRPLTDVLFPAGS